MIQKTEKKGHTVSVLFAVLLFLIFVLGTLSTVLTGGRAYGNITVRSDLNYTGNTALGYITDKVYQGDRAGPVDVVGVDGTGVLRMKQEIGGSECVAWVYWGGGIIRGLFTDTQNGLGLEGGLEILEHGGLELKKNGSLLHIETLGEGGGAINLSLRSGGLKTDK